MWGSGSSSVRNNNGEGRGASSPSPSSSAAPPPTSFSHYRRTSGLASQQSPNASMIRSSRSRGKQAAVEERFDAGDAWNLDEDDDDDDGVVQDGYGVHRPPSAAAVDNNANGRSTAEQKIARVAAQAGLGRRTSASSIATLPQTSASLTSLGAVRSASPSVATTSTSTSTATNASPAGQFKERGRQASYGFWERISGIGAAIGGVASGGGSGGATGAIRDNDEGPAESSGYSRFDSQLELEDNFDGTYSIGAPSSAAAGASGQGTSSNGKLLGPASISVLSGGTSPAAAAAALRNGKLNQSGSPSSQTGKGKSKALDSPGGATIVGVPRPRSPFVKGRNRPKDADEMRSFVRSDLSDVMKDPANLLKNLSLSSDTPATPASAASSLPSTINRDYYSTIESPEIPAPTTFPYDPHLADQSPEVAMTATELVKEQAQARRDATRRDKFIECLKKDTVDIAELRKLAWAGIPREVRTVAWQLLLGYLPSVSSRRVSVLARKRQEYADAVTSAFGRGEDNLDATLWHQIRIDVPRTNPGVPLWQFDSTQKSLERILYVWAIRHPASGYVQGINDLATPFFQVFLSSYIDCDPEDYDISALPPETLSALEADTFWCLSKLLDGIQDNYIFAQPGIHRQVARCQELCLRVDAPLAKHLEKEGVTFLQFSFRWFHLLFLRVLPVNAVIRMWDTYMSEGSDAFANFHTYVCLAFLLRWSEKLRSMDFQAIMLFLQDPVEHDAWTESMTELLLSEAYMWSALWSGSR